MTTADDVFATFELLEAILLSTPPHDILVSALAVSRTWYHTILSSSPLQQRLFFAPASTDTPWMQNPILAARFWPLFHRTDDFAEKLRAQCWGPCIHGHTRPARYLMTATHGLGDMTSLSEAGREAYLRPEASWRRMLALQPPVDVWRILQYVPYREDDPRGWDGEWVGPKRMMRLMSGLNRRKTEGRIVRTVKGLKPKENTTGMTLETMLWDMWSAADTTDEGEGNQTSGSRFIVADDVGNNAESVVYVDWWMDRNSQAMNSGREGEGPELQG